MYINAGARNKIALNIDAESPTAAAKIYLDDLFSGSTLTGPMISCNSVSISPHHKTVAWSALTDMCNKRLYISHQVKI